MEGFSREKEKNWIIEQQFTRNSWVAQIPKQRQKQASYKVILPKWRDKQRIYKSQPNMNDHWSVHNLPLNNDVGLLASWSVANALLICPDIRQAIRIVALPRLARRTGFHDFHFRFHWILVVWTDQAILISQFIHSYAWASKGRETSGYQIVFDQIWSLFLHTESGLFGC